MTDKKRGTPLSKLVVIDKLEVGPTRIEPKRVVTPYTVYTGKSSESFDFIYTFEDTVFEDRNVPAQNLGSMMGAQIALNYGLFCKEISFLGALDHHDQQFLTEMAKNTAREIYVNKFLEPNIFLRGAAASLAVVSRKNYLQAKLTFPNSVKKIDGKWRVNPKRHAISSSGGKDSLVTYGLLREASVETHPIFINESGRHWFTALNSYRHFAQHVPNTARVWTNSDRVFSWMLKHLPFIRPDYADVRSDYYPVRLWTVAVFLFGTLPILRKREIGRLLVGNEYDTTEKHEHSGITHYSGLYDQSRYFDEMMSRYFQRKGWGVTQFSILRPCSEVLIETILAKRFPDLLTYQVSCHAATKKGERVLPCGKCEKCRRIVSMLTAMDEDPRKCGYTDEQIEFGLKSFTREGIHQESAGEEHLAFILSKKNKIKLSSTSVRAKEHPELMKLRFHAERSPMNGIPTDLRGKLYSMLLRQTDGAVKRSGRVWIETDPLTDPDALAPYKFESRGTNVDSQALASQYLLGELTWPEAQERLKQTDVALLPVGAVEQHGPHLPLDTDAWDADYLSREVAAGCSDPKPLVLPLVINI